MKETSNITLHKIVRDLHDSIDALTLAKLDAEEGSESRLHLATELSTLRGAAQLIYNISQDIYIEVAIEDKLQILQQLNNK